MRIFDNPFYLLKVSPRATKNEIFDAADELELMEDDTKAKEYAAILTNPVKRIEAEISYFPDADEDEYKLCIDYLSQIESNTCNIYTFGKVISSLKDSTCSMFNLEIALIERMGVLPNTDTLLNVCSCFDFVDYDEVKDCINYDRRSAGISEVGDEALVGTEIEALRAGFVKVCCDALDKLESMDLVDKLTEIVRKSTCDGEELADSLVYDLVDYYEKNAQTYFENNTPVIERMIEIIREAAGSGEDEKQINRRLDNLIANVKQWDSIAEPMQLAMQSRGEEHELSGELAFSIRSLGIELYNEYGYLTASKKVIESVGEIFSEVFTVKEKVEEDKEALQGIEAQKAVWERQQAVKQEAARRMRAEKEEAERRKQEIQKRQFEREMSYSTTLGLAIKYTVSITADGIKVNNQYMRFDEIVAARWGTTVKQVLVMMVPYISYNHELMAEDINGNRLKIDFTDRYTEDEKFNNITSRFWKGTVDTMIGRLIKTITSDGLVYPGVRIEDEGALFPTISLWGNKPPVFVPWKEIDCSVDDGKLILWGGGKTVNLSFNDSWNIHYLHAILSVAKKEGFSRVSMLME